MQALTRRYLETESIGTSGRQERSGRVRNRRKEFTTATTVNAKVLKGETDITSEYAASAFVWTREFTTVAARSVKIQQIRRLKPANKLGNGYQSVKYQEPKANGKYTTNHLNYILLMVLDLITSGIGSRTLGLNLLGLPHDRKFKALDFIGEAYFMEFIYTPQMDNVIYEHEKGMYVLYSRIVTEYASDFAQYGCTLKLGYEWSNFLKEYTSLKRPPFKNGYEYKIYCEVQRNGETVRYNDDEGEVDYYELVSCWDISLIIRRGLKLNMILYNDVSDIKKDLDQHLFRLKQLS